MTFTVGEKRYLALEGLFLIGIVAVSIDAILEGQPESYWIPLFTLGVLYVLTMYGGRFTIWSGLDESDIDQFGLRESVGLVGFSLWIVVGLALRSIAGYTHPVVYVIIGGGIVGVLAMLHKLLRE